METQVMLCAGRLSYFVVLGNGTRSQMKEMREELRTFLAHHLHIELSMEKTKITHLNDGFKFLGVWLQRKRGQKGISTKVLIPQEAIQAVKHKIALATAPSTHQDALVNKIRALNRIIGGWSRYYQYTSRAATTFSKVDHYAFWCMAPWLGRKFRCSIATVMKRYYHRQRRTWMHGRHQLLRAGALKTRVYKRRYLKPNPYTAQEPIRREQWPVNSSWTGHEKRPGMADLRPLILSRDTYTCQICGCGGNAKDLEVDHIRPVRRFKLPVQANQLDNLQTICRKCHQLKTKSDRQMESPVP